jgi:hypothetical protein
MALKGRRGRAARRRRDPRDRLPRPWHSVMLRMLQRPIIYAIRLPNKPIRRRKRNQILSRRLTPSPRGKSVEQGAVSMRRSRRRRAAQRRARHRCSLSRDKWGMPPEARRQATGRAGFRETGRPSRLPPGGRPRQVVRQRKSALRKDLEIRVRQAGAVLPRRASPTLNRNGSKQRQMRNRTSSGRHRFQRAACLGPNNAGGLGWGRR